MNDEVQELFNKLGYDNVFFPFEDCFRNDRVVAYSHKTGNRIEITDSPYVYKFNEETGRMHKITKDEYSAIVKLKESLGWNLNICLSYVTPVSDGVLGIPYRNKSFYSKDIDMKVVEPMLRELAKTLNFEEICKLFREICFDQVAYWSDENKGIIYKDETYNKINREQACQLQRKVSTAVDLFSQSIINKNTFEEGYLLERLGK